MSERVAQFRDQTRRFLTGELSEDEFRHLRLRNGLYIQRHAPDAARGDPVRTAVFATQLRALGENRAPLRSRLRTFHDASEHLQFNWPKLEEVPDILAELAEVEMHSIQTSGNCIRNTTSDHLAGVTPDELEDPRPWCETHPPMVDVSSRIHATCRANSRSRSRGRRRTAPPRWCMTSACTSCAGLNGEPGFEILAGGGLGRTPIIGQVVREFLPREHLLSYLEAILRVYNLEGRRDNMHKARIKILVRSLGIRGIHAARGSRMGNTRDSGLRVDDCGNRASARLLRSARLSRAAGREPAAGKSSRISRLVSLQHRGAQGAGLSRGVCLAQEARRGARRYHRCADGIGRRSRRALQFRRGARDAHAESIACRCGAGQDLRTLADARARGPRHAEYRHPDRHDLLSRAWIFAVSRMPVPSMWRSSSTSASTTTIISTIWANSRSRCRAA